MRGTILRTQGATALLLLLLAAQPLLVPPRFVIECVLAEMRAFAGKPATESPLRANCVKKVDALAALTGSETQAL